MKATITATVLSLITLHVTAGPAAASCPPDSVQVGRLCVDKYEASVWKIPDTLANKDTLIAAIQAGMITSALQMAGAVRRGESSDDYSTCPDNGGGACTKIYAVSIAGVRPTGFTTWFQAAAACANSGKRLPTNQEWTVAALGTPDPGPDNDSTDCNSTFDAGHDPTAAGARSACVSSRGAYDMAGNMWEWVADWVPLSTGVCPGWGGFSNDQQCLAGADTATSGGPGALVRGGDFGLGTVAGPLAVLGDIRPSVSFPTAGFRCAREL